MAAVGGVLVTGGAGYLGSVLVPLLLGHGHRVTVVDSMAFGPQALAGVAASPGLRIVELDLASAVPAADLFDGVEATIHLAALSSPWACAAVADGVAEAFNVSATQRLVEAAAAAGVRRFVFASTCGVYGSTGEQPYDESSTVAPDSLYAHTKLSAETAVIGGGGSMHGVVLRLATLYGLAPRMRFDLVANTMVMHAVRNGIITVDGDGRQWRPLLHVDDAAAAFAAVLAAPAAAVAGEVFNVGTTLSNVRVCDLAERIATALGPRGASLLPEVEVRLSAPSDTRAVRSSDPGYRVSFAKAKTVLGFTASHEIEAACVDAARMILTGLFGDCSDEQLPAGARRQLNTLPAAQGGMPVRPTFLPLAVPTMGDEEIAEVEATLRSGWLTTGPRVSRFEEALAAVLDVRNVVAVSSCTAALQIALAALDIGPGDEVITSAITFPSTVNVILHQGARPVLVDIDSRTLNLDAECVERAVTSRTKAVIPVHLAGQPADMRPIWDLADRHGLHVVEDAAHALGARYDGRLVGGLERSTAACFSFYPTKNITTIEGGALTTNDDRLAALARLYSKHGLSADGWARHGVCRTEPWETLVAGFKANMTDVQAAVGIHQLGRLDGFLERREHLAGVYARAFAQTTAIELPGCLAAAQRAWHLFAVKLRLEELSVTRDEFRGALRRENIGSGIHFPPVHLQAYYRDRLDIDPSLLPHATDVGPRLLSLPLCPALTDDDVLDVISAVRKLLSAYAVTPSAESVAV